MYRNGAYLKELQQTRKKQISEGPGKYLQKTTKCQPQVSGLEKSQHLRLKTAMGLFWRKREYISFVSLKD
jgi:hypothetical protein